MWFFNQALLRAWLFRVWTHKVLLILLKLLTPLRICIMLHLLHLLLHLFQLILKLLNLCINFNVLIGRGRLVILGWNRRGDVRVVDRIHRVLPHRAVLGNLEGVHRAGLRGVHYAVLRRDLLEDSTVVRGDELLSHRTVMRGDELLSHRTVVSDELLSHRTVVRGEELLAHHGVWGRLRWVPISLSIQVTVWHTANRHIGSWR